MKRIIILLLLGFMTGCSAPYVRVVEYGTSGGGIFTSGSLGGCRVDINKDKVVKNVTIHYEGSSCKVYVDGQ